MKNTFLMKRILVIATLAVASHFAAYANVSFLNYGARRYVPAACYFSSPDIAAEEMPFLSSYTFCAANPVNIIDPSGNRITVVQHDGDSVELSYDSNNNVFYAIGTYTDPYVDDVVNNINIINQGEVGHCLAEILYKANNIVSISDNDPDIMASYSYKKFEIQWNTYNLLSIQYQKGSQTDYEEQIVPHFIPLAHEMFHAVDELLNTFDTDIWFDDYGYTALNCEKFAIVGENYIRAEHNLPLRAAYGPLISPTIALGTMDYPLSNYTSENNRSEFITDLLYRFK